MSEKLKPMLIRFSKEDLEILEKLAKYYGVTKADVVRLAVKEFAMNHGFME